MIKTSRFIHIFVGLFIFTLIGFLPYGAGFTFESRIAMATLVMMVLLVDYASRAYCCYCSHAYYYRLYF